MEPDSTSLNVVAAGKGLLLGGKQLPFLATKVVPPRSPGLIERPRLLAMASQLPAKRLAVIKAPAGFGKTSLAASWSESLRQRGSSVAWLTIDSDDDEPPRFLSYLTQAIQRPVPRVGADALDLIKETFLISPQAIVSSLINDLTDVDEEIYLFLEDYHWVSDPGIDEAVAFFIKHAPSHTHVVITTRTEPSLSLATLRAKNQLLEIDASALRFDEQETRDFLERERPGILEPADVNLLHSRTGGWPAALRIVVATSVSTEEFLLYVRNLPRPQRSIDAYLEEMLQSLPREFVLFMLRTAIFDRISAPLCESVTRMESSRALLASIEKRQLLLTAIARDGEWYRYHPLLAEYLKQRAQSEIPREIPELHQRAADWYASHELWTEAVQHALAAGHKKKALGWIKNSAMGLVRRGDLFTLLAWQRLFPPAVMKGQHAIKLAIAWGLALAIRPDDAAKMLDEIERELGTRNIVGRDVLKCECNVIRSVALSLKDQGRVALPLAQECLAQSTDPWTANVASNVVSYWHLKTGNLKKFYETPWIPYSVDDDRRNLFALVYRRCIQGIAEANQLRFVAAERYHTEALMLAEQHVGPNSMAAALPAALISRIRYEQGRVEEAETMLVDRLPLIGAGAMLECVQNAYFVMVRAAVFRSNLARAYTLLERAENLGEVRGWGRLRAAAVLERIRLHLREGRINEGAVGYELLERLAQKYHPSIDFAWSDIQRFLALGRAYVASAQQRFEDAISILRTLKDDAERAHNRYFALRVAVQLSALQFSANRTGEAVGDFRSVLTISAEAGIRQTILDESPHIGALLSAFQRDVARTRAPAGLARYAAGLLEAWQSHNESGSECGPEADRAHPLSTREAIILDLIAKGRSNKEIARDLDIGPETVKSHVKHIFTKLGAEKRAQAVARAQSLGLVTTH